MRRKHTVGLAIRLNLHALVTRSIWSQAGTVGEEFVCARGRDSKRIVNSLVLILCEALLPICVLLGGWAGGSFNGLAAKWIYNGSFCCSFYGNNVLNGKFLD